MTIQLTIIRIEGYGPWTVSLGSDREADLQMLQASFYCDLQRVFSAKDCLVYSNRFDEYFAITSGLSVADHLIIESELAGLYKKLKLSMAIGNGTSPFQANLDANKARKMGKTSFNRARIFGQTALPVSISNHKLIDEAVQILHIDMNNSADLCSNLSPYEITSLIIRIHVSLSEEFLKRESLTFFIGGDNFMVVSNTLTKQEVEETLEEVTQEADVKLNCGIGMGRTGRRAANAATKALDTIRNLRRQGTELAVYEIKCL